MTKETTNHRRLSIPRAHAVPAKAIIVTSFQEQASSVESGRYNRASVSQYLVSQIDIGDDLDSKDNSQAFASSVKALEYLFSLARRRKETWAFVLGAAQFLRAALAGSKGNYANLEAPVWVDAGTPCLALLVSCGRSLWIADVRNYCDLDYRTLGINLERYAGEAVATKAGKVVKPLDPQLLHLKCRAAVYSILGYCSAVFPECWSGTAAGLGWNVWLRMFNSMPLMCHDSEKASELESKSLFGGRVECFRLGEVLGPIYRIDRCCHYPATAIDSTLPVKLMSDHHFTLDEVMVLFKDGYSACAAVEINCNHHAWPVRVNGQPQWCVGSYLTYLAGKELEQAIYLGCVRKVRRIAYYEVNRPLFGISNALMEMRAESQKHHRPAIAALAKRCANGLYGRLLRKERVWEIWPEASPPTSAGEWFSYFQGKGKAIRCMTFRGKTVREVGTRPHKDSHIACGGHVLAAARVTMDSLRRVGATDHCFYMCCDGLHVDKQSYNRIMLRPGMLESGPGSIRLEGIAESAVYRGIYDYSCGDKIVQAGVPRLVGPDGLPMSRNPENQAVMFADQWDRRDPILVLEHASNMTRTRYDGLVQENGWIKTRALANHGLD